MSSDSLYDLFELILEELSDSQLQSVFSQVSLELQLRGIHSILEDSSDD